MTIKMKNNFKILLSYIKDLSVEIPNTETLIATRDNISKYSMDINITSKALKNKMIEVTTKLTYKDPSENKLKSQFEIQFSSVIKILEENIDKNKLEKLILCDLQNETYPRLEKIFLNIIKDAGFPEMKFAKKINFEQLYNNRLN